MKKIILSLIVSVFVCFGSVDINNASVEELVSLKGIGKQKAEAIVEYRKEHCFKSKNELVNVKGIGQKIVEKNQENIKVGSCPNKQVHKEISGFEKGEITF